MLFAGATFAAPSVRLKTMRSLLLTSLLVATVAIGTARDPDARRGLRRARLQVALFNALYAFACVYVFHRLP